MSLVAGHHSSLWSLLAAIATQQELLKKTSLITTTNTDFITSLTANESFPIHIFNFIHTFTDIADNC